MIRLDIVQNLYKFWKQEAKCFNTTMSYTTDAHFYNPLVKVGSISFFSSSGTQKFHHLLEFHATGINFSVNPFLSALRF